MNRQANENIDNDEEFDQFLRAFLFHQGHFPEEPLRDMVQQGEKIVPFLLYILDCLLVEPDKFTSVPIVGHYYALFLLAQFREKKAYPLVLRYLSLPDNYPEEVFGTSLATLVPSIIASVYDGDPHPLYAIIENSSLNSHARDACVLALLILCNENKIAKDDLVPHWLLILEKLQKAQDRWLVTTLVFAIEDLHLEALYEPARKAIIDGAAYSEFMTLQSFEEGIELFWEYTPGSDLINDAVESLSQLDCFEDEGGWDDYTPEQIEHWGEETLTEITWSDEFIPITCLQKLISQPQEAANLLLDILAKSAIYYSEIPEEGMAHFFALYLLAQFRDKRALRPMLQLFSKANDKRFDEVISRDGARLLASCSSDPAALYHFIEDPHYPLDLRAIAISTLFILLFHKKIERVEMVRYVHFLIDYFEQNSERLLLAITITEALSFRLTETFDRLGGSFHKGAVDEEIIDLRTFKNAVLEGECYSEDYRLIDDIFEEMRDWSCFRHKKKALQVGRNDLCPCGSGKKHKKCCLT